MQATRIMLVEDERIVALHLRQQLSKLGYEVVGVVASGEQALERVRELKPDVVLMDIHIEGELDGIETAARLPEDLQIPVGFILPPTRRPRRWHVLALRSHMVIC